MCEGFALALTRWSSGPVGHSGQFLSDLKHHIPELHSVAHSVFSVFQKLQTNSHNYLILTLRNLIFSSKCSHRPFLKACQVSHRWSKPFLTDGDLFGKTPAKVSIHCNVKFFRSIFKMTYFLKLPSLGHPMSNLHNPHKFFFARLSTFTRCFRFCSKMYTFWARGICSEGPPDSKILFYGGLIPALSYMSVCRCKLQSESCDHGVCLLCQRSF